ncbi:hypothetical protein ACE6ED_20660 [Paenibacillus sp. CN-4]|uniref:hypothetical protein n=1 Tax=Paenibacillus nanchangensis TaxID=3348343 RepID=UPI00397B0B1C
MIKVHEFVVGGKEGGFVKIIIEEVYGFPKMTSHLGGYDAKGTVEAQTGLLHSAEE